MSGIFTRNFVLYNLEAYGHENKELAQYCKRV